MTHTCHSLRQLSSGHHYTLDVYTYDPPQSKGTVYLQAALHGSEVQGVSVLYALIKQLSEINFPYTVKCIPFANPMAADTRVGEYTLGRFDPKTGVNWNRGFVNLLSKTPVFEDLVVDDLVKEHKEKPFEVVCDIFEMLLKNRINALLDQNLILAPEEKLALLLHREALGATYVFDLHCDSISIPYLYLPSYLISERLRNLKSSHFVATPCQFSPCFNQAIFYPWWRFTKSWNQATGDSRVPPLHSFTYELGSKERFDLDEGRAILEGILSYICSSKEVFTQENQTPLYVCDEKDYLRIRAPMGGVMAYNDALLGEVSEAGFPLSTLFTKKNIMQGSLGQEITHSEKSILLTRTATSLVHEGDEIIKIMTNFSEQ